MAACTRSNCCGISSKPALRFRRLVFVLRECYGSLCVVPASPGIALKPPRIAKRVTWPLSLLVKLTLDMIIYVATGAARWTANPHFLKILYIMVYNLYRVLHYDHNSRRRGKDKAVLISASFNSGYKDNHIRSRTRNQAGSGTSACRQRQSRTLCCFSS